MKKIVNSLFVLVFGLGLVSGGMVNVGATSESTEPSETTEASVVFTAGGLEFNPDTKKINFGVTKLDETELDVNNDIILPGKDSFAVNLTDARGLGNTWTLKAKLGKFTDINDKPTLEGAKISFIDGEVKSALDHKDINDVNPTIVLTNKPDGDNTVKVFDAKLNSNTGKWTFTWSNIKLYVPAKFAQEGTHTATITWSLTDAP